MPYVNIKVTREGTSPGATGTTAEQKAALIKGVSDLLFDVLGKPQDSTFIVIDEVELENWGWGGLPVADYRKQLASRPDGEGNTMDALFPADADEPRHQGSSPARSVHARDR
jgi:4-oxalocrotonate tautomerase